VTSFSLPTLLMTRLTDPISVEFLDSGDEFQVHLTYPGLDAGHPARTFHHLGLALPKVPTQFADSPLAVRREHLLPLAWALVRAWVRSCLVRRQEVSDADDATEGVPARPEPGPPLAIREDRRGEWMPPVHPLVSKHRSYRIAVGTAKRRAKKAGESMAVVAWHDGNSVVMPAEMAKGYDAEVLFVEFV